MNHIELLFRFLIYRNIKYIYYKNQYLKLNSQRYSIIFSKSLEEKAFMLDRVV
jgi:hypothetical protein